MRSPSTGPGREPMERLRFSRAYFVAPCRSGARKRNFFLVFNRPGAIAGVQAGRSHKHSYRGIDLTAGGIASITPWRTTLEGGNATQLLGPDLDGTYTNSQPHMESDLSVYHQLSPGILWGYGLPMSSITVGCEPTSRFTTGLNEW